MSLRWFIENIVVYTRSLPSKLSHFLSRSTRLQILFLTLPQSLLRQIRVALPLKHAKHSFQPGAKSLFLKTIDYLALAQVPAHR